MPEIVQQRRGQIDGLDQRPTSFPGFPAPRIPDEQRGACHFVVKRRPAFGPATMLAKKKPMICVHNQQGVIPQIVVRVVMRIGRKRILTALINASSVLILFCRFRL